MADINENMKPSNQTQYHEPRHPVLYIILYSIGSALCVPIGFSLIILFMLGTVLNSEGYTGFFLFIITGGAIATTGPLLIIFFFLKTFKTSRFKKNFLILLIAIPVILIFTIISIFN